MQRNILHIYYFYTSDLLIYFIHLQYAPHDS